MEWFKFYGKDFVMDAKIQNLSVVHRLMFVYLLCYVSNSDDGTVEYLTEWQLGMNCGITEASDLADDVPEFFSILERLGIIKKEGDTITVLKYAERQNKQLSGAERAKRYRDKQRESHERNDTNVTNVPLEKRRVEKKRNNIYTPDFLSFYDAYPKHVEKKKAFAIWKRRELPEEEVAKIMDFLQKAKKTKKWREGFIPNPTTFLNGDIWNDDLKAYGGVDKKGGEEIWV